MYKLYSHYSKSNEKANKKLYTHLQNVALNSKSIILDKDLNITITKKEYLAEISYLIGIAHDFGKSTTYFQDYLIYGVNSGLSHHGLISAFFGFLLVNSYCNDDLLALIAYMVIKKHHGNLESPIEDIERTFDDIEEQTYNIKSNHLAEVAEIYEKLLENYDIDFLDILDKLEELAQEDAYLIIYDRFENILSKIESIEDDSIELFLLTNLLYSVLIDSDKKDAARVDNSYFEGGIKERISVESYIEDCRKKDPEKFDPSKPINKARNNFLDEVINNPNVRKDNYLYSLTAPTGIGKTFTSFAFANKLKNYYTNGRRIIYCLPFTSIIDQNYNIFETIIQFNLGHKYDKYPTKYLLRHHYLTPLRLIRNVEIHKDSKEARDLDKYLEDKLLLESWESANIVTTFVQLLESIIGNRNSFLKKFHNIINSIIILDEVQNIPPKYYKIVGKVFKVLAQRFNTHILLLTATQPEIIHGDEVIELVDNTKYSTAPVFDRVRMEVVDGLKEKTLEEFAGYFKQNFKCKSGLIVCNTIKSALALFKKVSNIFPEYKVYSLTTYLTPLDRKNIIDEIKKSIKDKDKVIVISTQLIEAGVDLSFEEVYRDLGPLDSIVQVAGRCNRNGELEPQKGIVRVVQLKENEESKVDCKKVYDSILIQFCEEVLEKQYYCSVDFITLSKKYFSKIREKVKRESDELLEGIKRLNYSKEEKGQLPICSFELIIDQNGAKEDLIICTDKCAEDRIDELKNLYEKIIVANNKEKFNSVIGEIEIKKKELAKYRVSVYKHHLKKYSEHSIIKEFRFIKYVSYDDQKEYLYDSKIGFLEEPKKTPQSLMMF